MPPSEPDIAFRSCLENVQRARNRVLLIDYDGTIAPFHIRPEAARPYPDVCSLIETIQNKSNTRVVLVSGRWIRDLIPLLPFKKLPEIWGLHGGERLKPGGEHTYARMDSDALGALVEADEWSEEVVAEGARCERKPGSFAIHWRGLPQPQIANIRNMALAHLNIRAHGTGLSLLEFNGGMEFRTWQQDKGVAVSTVLSEYQEDMAAVYIGDDITDEDAFKAIKGRGCGVLVTEKPRPTGADYWVKPYQGVLNFLSTWKELCGG